MNKLKELKVVFETEGDKDFAAELIADCFYKNEITGVVIESPQEKTDDWGEDAILADKYSVSGYINIKESEKEGLIKKDIEAVLKGFDIKLSYHEKFIEEEDWANSWKDFFYPVEVSERIVIKPTWRQLDKHYDIVVNIDPGMAFGSGSHPTTNLCIKMLEESVKEDHDVLDIGCGSGILMIAASKLGAKFVSGLDNDSAAVDISEANLILNDIEKSKFKVFKSDLVEHEYSKYDLIVANILAEVVCELIPDLEKVSRESTIFIFSGIIEEKKEMVLNKMEEFGIKTETVYTDSGWVSIRGRY